MLRQSIINYELLFFTLRQFNRPPIFSNHFKGSKCQNKWEQKNIFLGEKNKSIVEIYFNIHSMY